MIGQQFKLSPLQCFCILYYFALASECVGLSSFFFFFTFLLFKFIRNEVVIIGNVIKALPPDMQSCIKFGEVY